MIKLAKQSCAAGRDHSEARWRQENNAAHLEMRMDVRYEHQVIKSCCPVEAEPEAVAAFGFYFQDSGHAFAGDRRQNQLAITEQGSLFDPAQQARPGRAKVESRQCRKGRRLKARKKAAQQAPASVLSFGPFAPSIIDHNMPSRDSANCDHEDM